MTEEKDTTTGGRSWTSSRAAAMELSRLSAALAGGAQRTRLLINGVAGPLNERQRSLALDLLRDLDMLCDAATQASASLRLRPENVTLGPLVTDVVAGFRFLSRSRRISISVTGTQSAAECLVDRVTLRQTLVEALRSALTAAPAGARVHVDVVRTGDRLAVDILAAGWDPASSLTPPPGAGIAVSVLRLTNGSRVVLSMPTAPAQTAAAPSNGAPPSSTVTPSAPVTRPAAPDRSPRDSSDAP